MKEIKFKIIGRCSYTFRYFVQIIYQKEGVYAKITDFYKCIGTAKEITTEIWDGDGDISQVDLERFTAAEKIKEESDTSMTPSVATSNASSTQAKKEEKSSKSQSDLKTRLLEKRKAMKSKLSTPLKTIGNTIGIDS